MFFYQVGSALQGQLGNLGSRLFTGTMLIVLFVIMGSVILGTFFYIRHRKSFNIQVEIQSSRSSGIDSDIGDKKVKDYEDYVRRQVKSGAFRLIYDKAALKYDRESNGWYFKILGEKIRLPAPPFNVLQPSNKGMVLKLWQKSAIEYFYLLPGQISKAFIVKADGKKHPVAEQEQFQLESKDVMWIVDKQKKNKSWIDPESILWKLLQYAPQIIMAVIFLFLIWIVIGKLPPLIETLNRLAENMGELTQSQFQNQNGG